MILGRAIVLDPPPGRPVTGAAPAGRPSMAASGAWPSNKGRGLHGARWIDGPCGAGHERDTNANNLGKPGLVKAEERGHGSLYRQAP